MSNRTGRFGEFEPNLDLPALDREVLALWRDRKVFQRSLDQRAGAPRWVFYEGPPTANGLPGVHHVEARTFKDLFPRFRTMRGYRVDRKAGWDCHGLPVELEVEKQLGFKHKRDIEAYGIEAFNARCRESVKRYVDAWGELTERIGFWVDTDDAYWTMDADYVESVWWSLATLHRKGLLYEGYKVVPYCPRCGTALSDAEVAMGYEEVEDLSAYVVITPTTGRLAEEGAGLLVWTTQPWTLVPNVSVVVGPHIRYVLVEATRDGVTRKLVVAEDLVEQAVGPDAQVLRPVPVDELVGTRYERVFDMVPVSGDEAARGWTVVADDYVTTTDGSGLVQTSPAYGAEDLAVGLRHNTPILHPVEPDGRFGPQTGWLAGKFVKDADAEIIEDLRRRGMLWRVERYSHSYPFCWRCHSPLLYYAMSSWYAKTTAVKDRMLAENAEVGWRPEHIRDGRFGDWLANNVDWALSRSRYWGTPLPLWRCAEGHVTSVESRAALGELAGRDLSALDPHRPYVDEVTFPCPEHVGFEPSASRVEAGGGSGERLDRPCGLTASRVTDVLDAWFDSGSMPFAQWGYPHEGADEFERAFPADFISEAIDQTRGWFYSLLAVNTMLFDTSPYRNVVCLGLLVDMDGRKMSKSLGNVLDPFELVDAYGADSLRWFMLATGSPWVARRLAPEVLAEINRGMFATLWNTASFFSLYAGLASWDPRAEPTGEPTELDRWILGELDRTVRVVTEGLDDYDPSGPARRLAEFVDDLSNWYVRLSRRRFWGDRLAPGDAHFRTLWTSLRTLSLLLAPYTPFLAEVLWQRLVVPVDPDATDSVHLADWPEPSGAEDARRSAAMTEARRLVGLGRQARIAAKVKVRQPLAHALVTVPTAVRERVGGLLDLVAAELNVKDVGFAEANPAAGPAGGLSAAGGRVEGRVGDAGLVSYRLAPNFRVLGPRFGKQVGAVAGAVRAADGGALGPALLRGERVDLDVDGVGTVQLGPDEVEVHEQPVTGWRVVRDGASSVALDLEVSRDLRLEGLARELVRAVQDLRKASGLAVTDRIELAVRAAGDAAEALAAHRDWVLGETLATSLHTAPRGDGFDATLDLDGAPVRLWLRPVSPAGGVAPD